MMVQRFRLRNLARRFAAPLIALSALIVAAPAAPAQEYTCFPTCSTTDGRFLALAGAGMNTFAGDEIRIGIGMPGNTDTLVIGIFDGETSGRWDIGSAALRYTLYADRTGNGDSAVYVDEWLGSTMTENDWYTITVPHVSSALSNVTGNYMYYLHVESTDTVVSSTSSFKLRTNGTITIRSHQAFSIYSPLTKDSDGQVIFPNYPTLDTTTYDGTWNIFVDVPTPSSSFSIWDGDMDYGSYDGTDRDGDDPNTSSTKPDWATPAARGEGVATSTYRLSDGTYRTSDPADNNSNAMFRRSSSIYYQVIDPNNTVYQNSNPSGNLEWEKFVIDTAAYDETVNDVHASSLPAGIYKVRLIGMDMGNVNAWRFFNEVIGTGPNNEVLGVNIDGDPVIPVRAIETIDGSISGILYYDADSNGTRAATEVGIPNVQVILTKYYPDGTVQSIDTTETDATGSYSFADMGAASYTITVNMATLQEDVIPVADSDGASTDNTSAVSLDANDPDLSVDFGYKRLTPAISNSSGSSSSSSGASNCTASLTGTRTRGYWANHSENWPVSSLYLGSTSNNYDVDDAISRVLQRPTKGDVRYSMAAQVIAAKLNIQGLCAQTNSAFAEVRAAIQAADQWLAAYSFGSSNPIRSWTTPSGWPGDTEVTITMSPSALHDFLDDFNNNGIPGVVGHMD